jgi:hypothetical protein
MSECCCGKIFRLQERQVKEKQVNHCKQLLALHNQLAETRKQVEGLWILSIMVK